MIGAACALAAASAVFALCAARAAVAGGAAARLRPAAAPDALPRRGGSRVRSRLGPGSVGVLVGAVAGALAPWPAPVVLVPVLALAGARVPRFAAARKERRRRAAVDAEIPQLLDLLAAASSAGLSAPLALRRSVVGLHGPLAAELEVALGSVDLGGRWRDELGAVAERLALPDLRRTVVALTRTETLGSSLSETTAELAATVRQARRAITTERARTAPVKMLFPLVFLVLPAFLLLTVVPVLLTTLQSIR